MVADPQALAHHVTKWLAREPEMRFAEVFCAANDKLRFHAWGALLHELREAVFELDEARVAEAKRSWWAEELLRLGSDLPRHPLTQSLIGTDAPWSRLAGALAGFHPAENRAVDVQQAIDLWLPLAEAVIAVEAALFSVRPDQHQARTLVVHWLLHRLPQGLRSDDRAGLPLQLLARHGLDAGQVAAGQGDALLRDWARLLLQACETRLQQASLLRRSRRAFDRARLSRLQAGRGFSEPPALASLWRAWVAARGASG